MTRLLVVSAVLFGAASSPAGAEVVRCDPGFIGVALGSPVSIGPNPGDTFGCIIGNTIPGGTAEASGLKGGEVVFAIDGVRLRDCDHFAEIVAGHSAGDTMSFEVGAAPSTPRTKIAVGVTTRGDVMRRSLLGKAIDLPVIKTEGLDAKSPPPMPASLSTTKRATIVGFFAPECECAALFAKISQRAKGSIVGVTYKSGTSLELVNPAAVRDAMHLDVPLAVSGDPRVDNPQWYNSLFDRKRATFAVLDAYGAVRYIAPIAPDGEDLDAALDELVVAADAVAKPVAKR